MKREIRELFDRKAESEAMLAKLMEPPLASENGDAGLPLKRKRGRPRKFPAASQPKAPQRKIATSYAIHLPIEISQALYRLQAKRKKEEYVHYHIEALIIQGVLLLLHREGVLPSECQLAIRRFLDQKGE